MQLVAAGLDRDHGPEHDAAGHRLVDDDGAPQAILERLDATLEERLLRAGRVVLGVLLEVAVLTRGLDSLDDLGPLDAGQLVELDLEPGEIRARELNRLERPAQALRPDPGARARGRRPGANRIGGGGPG